MHKIYLIITILVVYLLSPYLIPELDKEVMEVPKWSILQDNSRRVLLSNVPNHVDDMRVLAR